MPGSVLVNGHLQAPGLSADRAFHFGDGLFETLAVNQGVPCLWGRHYRRLSSGCERLGLKAPDPDLLRSEAERLCSDDCSGDAMAVLKIVISAGPATRGYARDAEAQPTRWLRVTPWPSQPHYRDCNAPLKLQWCETQLGNQPMLAGLKHLNRLEQVMARRELREPAMEGLVCDLRGNVVEGTVSNLFLRFGEHYQTPELSCCGIDGVVRQLVIESLQQQGVLIEQSTISRECVEQADALYLCNSLLGVRAVSGLGERQYTDTILPPVLRSAHVACFTRDGIS